MTIIWRNTNLKGNGTTSKRVKKKKGVNILPCTLPFPEELENIFITPYIWFNFQAVIQEDGADSRDSTHFGPAAFGGETPDKQVVRLFHAPQAWAFFALFAHELARGVAVSTAAQLVIGSLAQFCPNSCFDLAC